MAILKCKMCGGDLNIVPGESVCECEYCGSCQTIPNQDDEKKLLLFERANRLRYNCEFDKAAGLYESIVADYRTEAEAYWGLVLCKYGIEYVTDPATSKKVPTCHRSSFDSVMEDPNFDLVMENADAVSLPVYRQEAKQIEELRRHIVSVSSKEEPYDIFICYKETDENGERTLDSVLAQDIYMHLTDKGYRVFFSRISLEDKLGIAYEPFIFAALNSAKIMLAIGTTPDHYQAVWVRNEWSRYLKLMETDHSKRLFACYKNMNVQELPREIRHLQGQDMDKIGSMQDLLRGIEKTLPLKASPTAAPPVREKPSITVEKKKPNPPKKPNRTLLCAIALVVAVIVVFLLVAKVFIPAGRYAKAEKIYAQGSYTDAALLYEALGDYSDAAAQANLAREKAMAKRISQLQDTGLTIHEEKYVIFGHYEQNNSPDSTEPIEWIPLAVSNGQVLLISRYALDLQTRGFDIPWAESPMRAWLNNDFLANAFSPEERRAILPTTNDNPIVTEFVDDTLKLSGDEGSTTDTVFLLSAPEVLTYLGRSDDRFTAATAYAKSQGAYVGNNGNTWWALRTDYCNFVGAEDGFGATGVIAVRPVIWLDIDAVPTP